MRKLLRVALTLILFVAMCAALAISSSNWTIALVPLCIIVIVYINLGPLVELVIHLAGDDRKRPR